MRIRNVEVNPGDQLEIRLHKAPLLNYEGAVIRVMEDGVEVMGPLLASPPNAVILAAKDIFDLRVKHPAAEAVPLQTRGRFHAGDTIWTRVRHPRPEMANILAAEDDMLAIQLEGGRILIGTANELVSVPNAEQVVEIEESGTNEC